MTKPISWNKQDIFIIISGVILLILIYQVVLWLIYSQAPILGGYHLLLFIGTGGFWGKNPAITAKSMKYLDVATVDNNCCPPWTGGSD